ncbi:MAG: quinone-dependent dihydroorotate dehydrogenase [Alphaproteobacteria bacterium]|nr:quinone-dependent dihydroorotate dehydrogenase [Alphaproteobacteria bacterium]
MSRDVSSNNNWSSSNWPANNWPANNWPANNWYGGYLIRLLDPEQAHWLVLMALKSGLAGLATHGPLAPRADDAILSTTVWGRTFPNPIGLAAGFDKNAEAHEALLRLGFGFVEIGSVTPKPQPGNPRPRLFRLTLDQAIINRMGFNNDGLAVVARRLAKRTRAAGIVGANLGMNKDTADAAADYEKGVAALAPLADYVAINVSSPNTPGLRALQGREPLAALIVRVRAALTAAVPTSPPPLLLKIAPDLTAQDRRDIAEVAQAGGVDGMIVSNTTIARPDGLRSPFANETGGLSGRPLFPESTALLRDMYAMTAGQMPLIGVGGVASGADAYAKIRAGASLVQLYTALVYQGPGLIACLKMDLADRLRADGFASVAEAVGADHRES